MRGGLTVVVVLLLLGCEREYRLSDALLTPADIRTIEDCLDDGGYATVYLGGIECEKRDSVAIYPRDSTTAHDVIPRDGWAPSTNGRAPE